MRRHLCIALSLIAGACTSPRATVASAPAANVAAKCSQERTAAIAYVVDGKAATCESAMALSADRIASVEVLKGAAAVSRYGVSAESGVIIIQTKRDR
jgi:TonB-dependent SusC/RagA subfamily outer membrane receptor